MTMARNQVHSILLGVFAIVVALIAASSLPAAARVIPHMGLPCPHLRSWQRQDWGRLTYHPLPEQAKFLRNLNKIVSPPLSILSVRDDYRMTDPRRKASNSQKRCYIRSRTIK